MGIGIDIGISIGLGLGRTTFNPVSLFGNGENGFYYDFTKTDRMFEDTIGQFPANVDNDPVGLVFDESKWNRKTLAELIAIQPERIVNGDGNSVAGWTLNQANGTGSLTAVGGKLRLQCLTGQFINASQSFSTVIGNWYRVAGEYTEVSTTGFRGIRKSDSDPPSTNIVNINTGTVGSSAFKDGYFQATATTSRIHLQVNLSGASSVIDFDNISLKDIPGIGSIQATAAARPLWKTGGFLRSAGVDDSLLTTFNPSAACTLAVKFLFTGVPATMVLMGSQTTNSAFLVVNSTDGKLRCGLGTNNSLLLGPDNRSGLVTVGVVAWDGTTVKLYQNGAEVGSVAQGAHVPPVMPMRICANNINNNSASWFVGDTYKALAINRALTLAEVQKLTTSWNAA